MRRNDHMARRFLAVFLASVLAYGNFGIQVALGVEASGGSVDVAEKLSEQTEESESAVQVEESAAEGEAESQSEAATQTTDTTNDPTPAAANDDTTTDGDADPAAETQPYSIEVTFGGHKLKDGKNDIADVWTMGAKILTVKLVRNTNVAVDPNKQYVLCMSVPDSLYFNGVPTADSITGVENVAMVRNAVPQINPPSPSGGKRTIALEKFSDYSGQIRMKLNPAVENVTVADLAVSFDSRLVGFKVTEGNALKDALSVRLVEVDGSSALDSFTNEDARELLGCEVSSLPIKNEQTYNTGSSVRMHFSTDGFTNENMIGANLNMNQDGDISYALATSQATYQVYKTLKVVFACPYIEVDSKRYYLSFSEDDIALKENKKGKYTGCLMANDAEYDAINHTITYTFSNAYLGAYQAFLYTPTFYWPKDLDKNSVNIPSAGIDVKRDSWKIAEQEVYAGGASSLLPAAITCTGKATIMPSVVNVTIESSAEDAATNTASQVMGKHVIYKELTRANGSTGALGFFDVHNKGVVDSAAARVTFKFNTGTTDSATYYVTRVNIPFDGGDGHLNVHYVLTDGTTDVEGDKEFSNTSSFSLYASTLRYNSGVGNDYYIKSISYIAPKLRKNGTYHSDVAHSSRNSTSDYGQFFGYMEGEVDDYAHATLTVESLDNGVALNPDGNMTLTSTETSWIGDEDYIGVGLSANAMVDGGTSQSVTAGESATLTFSGYISADEYHGYVVENNVNKDNKKLNGYHVMRDPVVYVCLPNDISVPGKEQASMTIGNTSTGTRKVTATNVKPLKNSNCTYNGVEATWWELRFEGANAGAGGATAIAVSIQLATSQTMEGVNWGFEKAIAIRGDGQQMSWTSQTTNGSTARNTVQMLTNDSSPLIQALGAGLADDPHATDGKLGVMYYTYSVNTTLNVSRAEAKLDVTTALSVGGSETRDVRVTDGGTEVKFEVNVSSTDGGHADEFYYYIPIPKGTATLDPNSFVSKNEFDLKLNSDVTVEDTSAASTGRHVPFEVWYTTVEGLDSTSIKTLPTSEWKLSDADDFEGFSAVTAIMIASEARAEIQDGSSYRFTLSLSYDDSASGDFGAQAGRSVTWRSFGHYTYQRGGGTPTTNSYPSQDNSVKLGYIADLTSSDPIGLAIDTGADSNEALLNKVLDQTFLNAQAMKIKNVTVSSGTTLVPEDPASKTGAEANSQFMMQFGINSNTTGMTTLSSGYSGGSYNVASGTQMTLAIKTLFSKALTDNSTPRNVVVQFGNDDVDFKVQINLIRTVAPAEVTGSGTAEGEQFAAADVNKNPINVPANAAFTALYHVENFIPGNFTAQKLVWKSVQTAGSVEALLPAGTKITMLVLGSGSDNSVKSLWLYTANGNEGSIDLNKFKRMGGSDNFTYATSGTDGVELKYQFVVSFPEDCVTTGSFSLGFAADPKTGAAAFATDDLRVNLVTRASFGLTVSGQTVSYTYTKAGASDSRTSGKLLALVLAPQSGSDALPADAKVTAGGVSYAKNDDGNYIVPLSTVNTGSVDLGLTSEMAPDAGGSYDFDVSLMLYAATATSENKGAAPQAGLKVGAGSVTLGVAASTSPSLKVEGTKRVGTKAEWENGCDLTFEVKNLPEGASLTVDAYRGLTGNTGQRVTDLMSAVVGDGSFEINNGSATYKGASSSGSRAGKLTLSSTAAVGTYRLVFKIADAAGNEVMSVPYYIVVRE